MMRNWFKRTRQPRSQSSAARTIPRRHLWLETLEDRTLLSPLPLPALNPNAATQVLFSPAPEIQIVAAGTTSELLRFALHGQSASTSIKFDLAPVNGQTTTTQSALALFDGDYNFLTMANAGTAAESFTATLQSGKVYALDVFFADPGAAGDFQLTTTPGPQVVNPTITINPATGKASLPVSTFSRSADVEYYPLDLTNGGAPGTVTVTPTGVDVQPNATLFRRDNLQAPWQPIAHGPQIGAVTLPLTPFAGENPTDAQYLLAVAPLSFNTVAGAFAIDVATTPLAPATVDPATAADLLTPAPVSLGVAQATAHGLLQGTAALYRFRAPGDGNATLKFASSAAQSLLSVYDATGTQLQPLCVGSAATSHPISLSLPVTAGTQYLVRVWDSGDLGGPYDLTVTTPYQTTPLSFQGNLATANGAHVDPATGAIFYRLTPAVSTDVLAVRVNPAPGNTARFVLVGPNGVVATSPQLGPGVPLFASAVLSGISGPYDLFVEGITGTDPVDVAIGQMRVARTLSLDQLTPTQIGLDGQLDPASQTTAANPNKFGDFAGLKYYELLAADPTASTTASVTDSGARPLLVHYAETGGLFHLVGFQLPDANGQAQVTDVFHGNQLHGLAAYALDLGSLPSSTLQFAVQTPTPVAVQLGSVPDLSLGNPPYGFIMDTQTTTLHKDFQQQLWQSILPQSMLNDPQVVFTAKSSQGPLQAKITVYVPGVPGYPTLTNQSNPQDPAAPVKIALPNFGLLQGQTVLLRVEPLAGLLGSGSYELTMKEPTSNPLPFLLVQKAWQFAGPLFQQWQWQTDDAPSTTPPGSPTYAQDHLQDPGTLPANIQVIDIPQNQYGHGQITTGTGPNAVPGFTSPTAGSLHNPDPGSIAVYRFWALNPGPVSVKTVAVPGSKVNTNIHVYKAKYDQSPSPILYLGQIDDPTKPSASVQFDYDWYQADRSQIDAQTFINDFSMMKYTQQPNTNPYGTGGGMYFVVVRNEQGSKGDYTLDVDTPAMPLGDANSASNQVTSLPIAGGSVPLLVPDLQGFVVPGADPANAVTQDFVGYFPIQMPNYHQGKLTVTADNLLFFDGLWDFHLYDAAGNELAGNTKLTNGGTNIVATFTVPTGLQVVTLRARREFIPLLPDPGIVTLSATVAAPTAPPVTNLAPATPTTILPTDPFGNALGAGQFVGSLATGTFKVFEFEAPRGAMTVNVTPQFANGMTLRWGAYVNNKLVAWGLGDSGASTFALPAVREPGDSTDFDFDRAQVQNVKLMVEAMTGSGGFTASVHSNVVLPVVEKDLADKPTGQPSSPDQLTTPPVKPLRDADLVIDTLTGNGATLTPIAHGGQPTNTSAVNWILLSVPVRATGAVSLKVVAGFLNVGQTLRYDLYDTAGAPIPGATGTATVPLQASVTFAVSKAVGGHSYFLRVGLVNRPEALLTVTASVPLPNTIVQLPPTIDDFLNPDPTKTIPAGYYVDPHNLPDPTPDGKFSIKFAAKELVPFWVGTGGDATITGNPDPGPNQYVALYRMDSIHEQGNGEFRHWAYKLKLLDYQDQADANSNFIINAYLDPGLYVLQQGSTSAYVATQLPAFPVQEMVLDPQDGHSHAPLDMLDQGSASVPSDEVPLGQAFRSRYYHAVAPAGSNGPLVASVNGVSPILSQADFDGGANYHTAAGNLRVWTATLGPQPYLPLGISYLDPLSPSASDIENPVPPQTDYWFRFQRFVLGGDAQFSADFTVPVSGKPDLVVTSIKLSPDSGQTRVDVTLENHGFGDAAATHALFQITDGNGHVPPGSDQPEPAIGPFGVVNYTFTFNPDSVTDKVTFTANSLTPREVVELSYSNNSKTAKLSDVDPVAPTISLALADPTMTSPGAVWGRYVTGIDGTGPHSDIIADVKGSNLYQVWQNMPAPFLDVGDGDWIPQSISAANPHFLIAKDFGFSALNRTDPTLNPNIVKVYAKDAFGLTSATVYQQINVVPRPNWVTGITWDEASHRYLLGMHQAFVDYHKDVSMILTGQEDAIPLIGGADNQFTVRLDADTTAGLDPSVGVVAPLNGQIILKVLDQDILNETFAGKDDVTENIAIHVSLAIQGSDLRANILKISFEFHDLKLFHYETPAIPLFTYGVPGVLNLNINIKFLIDIMLNAGVSLGLPLDLNTPPIVGLMAPTFVAPSITLGAKLSGAAQVLGFDLASIYGEVDFTLTVIVGLDTNDPAKLFPLDEFLLHPNLTVGVTGQLGLKFGAEVLGIEVFSFAPQFPPFQIAGTPGIPITTFPTIGTPPAWQPATPLTGSSALGALVTDPRPNVVIDRNTGAGLYVQVVDASSDPNHQFGNLSFATRPGGGSPPPPWSAPTTLAQPDDVANPVLALTHDQSTGAPAVVVYQAHNPQGVQNLNQLLTAQDIRYRYWNGTSWQSEQALTADALYDTNPVVAFNAAGQGLAAWTHNTNTTPMTTALDRMSNQIDVAVWDPANHVFLPPVMLTNTMGIGNSRPAVFAGDDGTLYVTWIAEDSNGVTTPMVGAYSNGAWTTQVLGVTGLPAGAVLGSLAMGSDGIGTDGHNRIDVLMTASSTQAGHAATSALYNRASLASDFLGAHPVETVATGSNFSFLSTTNDNSGALVAYWEQSDGQINDIHAAVRSVGGAWSLPAALSNDHGLKYAPALAVDSDGKFQTIFETKPNPQPTMLMNGQAVPVMAPGTNTPVTAFLQSPGPQDKAVGMTVKGRVGTASVTPAPELGFAQSLTFAAHPDAAAGTRAVGHAQIFNRGLVGTYVDIQYLQAGVRVDSMDKIYLGPGHTYDVSHGFLVKAGPTPYAILVSAVDANDQPVTEAVSTADDVTTASLTGRANLVAVSLSLSDPTPHDGEAVQVMADVRNDSSLPLGKFKVTLFRSDPRLSNEADPAVAIASANVVSLAAFKDAIVTFPWTVPAGANNYLLTAQVDSGNVFTESSETDNFAHFTFSVLPDAAVTPTRQVPFPVTAKVLNYSGVNNVQVNALVSNLGLASVQQVQVRLLSSLDQGPYQQVAMVVLPLLAANSSVPVSFTANGLAGRNNYRVVVDPASILPDQNRSNNVADTVLTLVEFPDLLVSGAMLVETPTPAQGQALTVRAQIKNQGIASARAVSVEVFVGNPDTGGFPIGQTTLDFLAALASATVDISVDTSKLIGFEPLWIIVNRLDNFPETSHFNNTLVLGVYFSAQDRTPPVSSVNRLPALTATPDFMVQWQGQDYPQPGGSGIAFFDIYVSVDGGRFGPWQRTAATSDIYHGLEGHSYAFFSRATDASRNLEAAPAGAQAQTAVPAPAAEIHGTVYNDANGNRHRDGPEGTLPGWTVFLDLNQDGVLQSTEPVTTTDQTGAYAFTGLRTGSYTVAEFPSGGWIETSPGTPAGPAEPDPSHFVNSTGPGMHYAWVNHGQVQGNTITILYDFRPIGSYANQITAAEIHVAEQALQAWSDASLGRLRFQRDTKTALANIINIGFGDMATVATASGPSLLLSRGGAMLGPNRTLSNGVVWLDRAAQWSTSGAAKLPAGVYSAYPVLVHELGLALGLQESADRTRRDMMDGIYNGVRTLISRSDRADIQALYPIVPPTPGTPTSLKVTLVPQQILTGANFGNFQPSFAFATTVPGRGPSAGFGVGSDDAGNVYAAGYVADALNVYSTDAYVSKTSPGGLLLWSKTFGDHVGLNSAFAMTVDPQGNSYVTGDFRGQIAFGNYVLTSTGPLDGFVIKLDTGGNTLWAHQFANIGNFGPPYPDRLGTISPKSIALDHAGNVVIAGMFGGHIDFDPIHPGQHTADYPNAHPGSYVVKLDAVGNFKWDAVAVNPVDNINAFAVAVDGQNNVYTLGQFGNHNWFNDKTANNQIQPNSNSLYLDGPNQTSLYLWKLTANGNNAWVRAMETSAQYSIAWGLGIAIDKNGNIYTTGSFSGTNVSFDPATNQAAALLTSGAGGSVANVFVDAVDKAGNFLWVRQVASSGASQGTGIALDTAGNIYVTGYLTAASQFGAQLLTPVRSAGNSFVTELTAAGQFVAAESSRDLGAGGDKAQAIVVDRDGFVDVTGAFDTQMDWLGLDTLTSDTLGSNIFTAKKKLH